MDDLFLDLLDKINYMLICGQRNNIISTNYDIEKFKNKSLKEDILKENEDLLDFLMRIEYEDTDDSELVEVFMVILLYGGNPITYIAYYEQESCCKQLLK